MNRNRLSVIGFLLFCLFVAAQCGAETIQPGNSPVETADKAVTLEGGPSAVFIETVYDFGRVRHDGEYEHDFQVRNIGTEDLVIRKVVVG